MFKREQRLLHNAHHLLPHDIVIKRGFALRTERDHAFLEGKEGIVLADADVAAGQEGGTALAEDDLADPDMLAMIDLNPQIFGV